MSESERNDLDDAIDRAAQQLVMHEPSPRLYAAVMADIKAGSGSHVRRTPSSWTTWRWALAGMSAAAIIVMSVLAWQTQRPLPPTVFPALPAPPQMARIAPPLDAAPTAPPKAPPSASPAGRPVPRIDLAHPQLAQTPVAESAMDVKRIQVATIPVGDISVPDVSVSTISIGDISVAAISVNTIEADAKAEAK